MTFIFPTDTKDDFTAENGVTYSWVEPSHWRVKSFKSPDGQTVIVDDDPPEHKEGQLWFCTKDEYLTLYISLSGQWVPASPPVSLDGITQYTEDLQKQITELAKNQTPYEIFLPVMEGVEYNTTELTNLRSRVVDVELVAGNALPKAGGTMTGLLDINAGRKEDNQTNSFIIRGNVESGTDLLKDWRRSENEGNEGRYDEVLYLGSNNNSKSIINLGYLEDRYLPLKGGTLTGDLSFKCNKDGEYFSYIRAQKPKSGAGETHGLILDIGISNTFKQQFKIIGRSGRDLFKINDDGSANAEIKGRLNVAEAIRIDGDEVATKDYVDEATKGKDKSTLVAYQKFYAKNRQPDSTFNKRCIYWMHKTDEVTMNISTETYAEPYFRKVIYKDQDHMDFAVDFSMHRVGRMEDGHNEWEIIMAGKTKSVRFMNYQGKDYIQIKYDISKCLVHHPEDFINTKDDHTTNDANYVNFQLGNIFRY